MSFERYKSTMVDVNLLDIPYEGFSGHVTPKTAYGTIGHRDENGPGAVIVDVRTVAEWQFVGFPDLPEDCFFKIEWQTYPTMSLNDYFGSALQQGIPDKTTPIFMLCRSGVRSMAAAQCAVTLGYRSAFNIAGGFEGDVNANGHRGVTNGWKADGLPWKQL
jgi:rhodanese-related sulfurtransferase